MDERSLLGASVVSDSVRPHRWQPTRLPHPWDSPGKNTGMGCHFLNQVFKWQPPTRSWGFPGGTSGKEHACYRRRHKRCSFDPWVGKIPWRRKWQPTPVFLPGESQGWGSLVGCHLCRDSAGVGAMEEGLISRGGRNLRLPLCF